MVVDISDVESRLTLIQSRLKRVWIADPRKLQAMNTGALAGKRDGGRIGKEAKSFEFAGGSIA